MHMALHAHNIGPGDEVITPSLTWVSTIILISAFGATPVFVDVDRNNFMVTAETIEPLISERTRLIIPVHYAGAAIDITSIELIQCIKQIPIIEDAAHAMGTEYSQRPIGADGRRRAYSQYFQYYSFLLVYNCLRWECWVSTSEEFITTCALGYGTLFVKWYCTPALVITTQIH